MNYLGWVANAFLFLAAYLLGRKWRHAFLLTAAGELLWLVASLNLGRWDMLVLCLVFGVLALRNWSLWGQTPPSCHVVGWVSEDHRGHRERSRRYVIPIPGEDGSVEVPLPSGFLQIGQKVRVTVEVLE